VLAEAGCPCSKRQAGQERGASTGRAARVERQAPLLGTSRGGGPSDSGSCRSSTGPASSPASRHPSVSSSYPRSASSEMSPCGGAQQPREVDGGGRQPGCRAGSGPARHTKAEGPAGGCTHPSARHSAAGRSVRGAGGGVRGDEGTDDVRRAFHQRPPWRRHCQGHTPRVAPAAATVPPVRISQTPTARLPRWQCSRLPGSAPAPAPAWPPSLKLVVTP
jgi:hypothetical protein